jgi:hypothetical protein
MTAGDLCGPEGPQRTAMFGAAARAVDLDKGFGRPRPFSQVAAFCLEQTNMLPKLRLEGAHSPPCLAPKLAISIVRGWAMTCDADAPTTVPEFEHLRSRQRQRQTERNTSNQAMTLAIKMLIGDWHVDELGIMTREITARD